LKNNKFVSADDVDGRAVIVDRCAVIINGGGLAVAIGCGRYRGDQNLVEYENFRFKVTFSVFWKNNLCTVHYAVSGLGDLSHIANNRDN
jgi:hypothetical protein